MNELETHDSAAFKGFLRMALDIFNELSGRAEPLI